MAEKNNAVCDVCGKGYYVCLSCSDAMKLHPFKSFTDTAEHFKVFQVVKGYLTGVYTKDEAKEKFKNIDLQDIETFRPHIKKIIKDVLGCETIVEAVEKVDAVKPVVEAAETEVTAVETVEENIIEDTVVEDVVEVEKPEKSYDKFKTNYSRKKNYK